VVSGRDRAVPQLALITAAAFALLAGFGLRGGSFAGLWLTADQRAALAFRDLEFSAAADQFEDPAWKGTAAYAAGRYDEAAAAFARMATAEGFFNRGNALMKNREYATAISAYEQAVVLAPDWAEARENLALARHVREYVERTREQSDIGNQPDMGADDYVFDNTRNRGQETEVSRESTLEAQSAEKWMRSVDTDTSEFLRSRFALEATRENGP